jgi:hypothetical protein
MLTKAVEMALSALFLAVLLLSRFRNHLKSRTPITQEEDHLMAEWIEARQKRVALQAELDRPTASRLYDSQLRLLTAVKTAGDKCHDLVVKLRAIRKRRPRDPN